MSIDLVRKEISRFLSTPVPEILCLKGKWGIGKTYSWNTFLRVAKDENKIALPRYAYVSLFGINRLEQLKSSIFENSIPCEDIGTEPSLESLRHNLDSVAERLARKFVPFLSHAPVIKNYAEAFYGITFLALKDTILCIDDIERRGEGLCLRDIFGLVSLLREQRNCKIVLILNEEALNRDRERDDYQRFFEKIIDVSLEFLPTAEQCSEIALQGSTTSLQILKKRCIALGIANIRIIKKIERLALVLEEHLKPYDTQVLESTFASIVLFAWCLYAPDEAPSIEFIRNNRRAHTYGLEDSNTLNDQQKSWNSTLDSYGFSFMDEVDLLVMEGIQRGYFDTSKLKPEWEKLDNSIKAQNATNAFHAAWNVYHDSFENDEEAVVQSISDGLLQHLDQVSPANFDAAVRLLKLLGKADIASEAINAFVQQEKPQSFFDLSNYAFGDEVKDTDVIAALKTKFES